MKKRIKNTIILAGVLFLLNPVFVWAQTLVQSGETLYIDEFLIYGEEYRLLANGRINTYPYNTIKIKVDAMYKDTGATSNYKTSLWAVTYLGNGAILKSGQAVSKGVEFELKISDMTDPSARYGINVKGNKSNLDALISGRIRYFSMSN